MLQKSVLLPEGLVELYGERQTGELQSHAPAELLQHL